MRCILNYATNKDRNDKNISHCVCVRLSACVSVFVCINAHKISQNKPAN